MHMASCATHERYRCWLAMTAEKLIDRSLQVVVFVRYHSQEPVGCRLAQSQLSLLGELLQVLRSLLKLREFA
jgi:hypothetical protein